MTPSLLLPLVVVAAPQLPAQELQRAVALFENLDDEKAAALFRDIVARNPPGAVASKAHLYLGLIALNAIEPDLARAEFRLAIEANPAAELPPSAPPKAHFAFDQAREELARKAAQGASVVPPSDTTPAPGEATSAPAAEAEAAPSHAHTWTWVLVGTAVACAAVAVFGGYEVASYNSMAGQQGVYTTDQLMPAYNQARFWSYGWPVAAGLAAAAGVGGAFAW